MIASPQLFENFLQCSTKCWLHSRAEPPEGNSYADWVSGRNKTYLQDGLKRLLARFPESDCATAPPIAKNPKDFTWRLAIDVNRTLDWLTRLPLPRAFLAESKVVAGKDGATMRGRDLATKEIKSFHIVAGVTRIMEIREFFSF